MIRAASQDAQADPLEVDPEAQGQPWAEPDASTKRVFTKTVSCSFSQGKSQ